MRVLHWHVHGSWTNAFVRGPHTYLVPLVEGRGADGGGRPQRPGSYVWPEQAVEVGPEQLREEPPDVVVLQRERDVELCRSWLAREPGRDLPAVWLEHNAPQGRVNELRHPAAGTGIPVVHVTPFNDLMWDCGDSPTSVVEHGIVDPGQRWTGERAAAAVVVNEPVRRARVTGTDLLPRFRAVAPVDLFGMRSEELGGLDLPQTELPAALASRRLYLHPIRWTSLGLALLEAMHLGMPVVAVGATEVWEAVPPDAGIVSTDVAVLVDAVRRLVADPAEAAERGQRAREAALARYGLQRFLDDWDRTLAALL